MKDFIHTYAPLRIAFYGTHDYDKLFFDIYKDQYNVEIDYIEERLTMDTAYFSSNHDAVCIFVNDDCSDKIIRELHKYGINLILLRCAGFNNIDLTSAQEFDMTILRVPEYSPHAVAEHAMAILQVANRRIHLAHNLVKYNNFELSGLMGMDLYDKTAGIVGTGKIGISMANICKGYGMKVIAWDKYPKRELEEQGLLTYVELEELYKESNLISLHAPLIISDEGTYHMINSESISLMKDDVMLVNTARGGLIDNEALIAAMKKGKFHAVALDVYEGEDNNVYINRAFENLESDITSRLQIFPSLVLTSHQAFFTKEALEKIAIKTLDNAKKFNERKDYTDALV